MEERPPRRTVPRAGSAAIEQFQRNDPPNTSKAYVQLPHPPILMTARSPFSDSCKIAGVRG
jgi:hypothetical protein